MSELNVGDKVYRCYKGEPQSFVVVDRVTKTQAIAGNTRFKREFGERGFISTVGGSGWSLYGHYIGTDELDYRYNRLCLVSAVRERVSQDLPDNVLKAIAKAFGLEWKLD